MFLKNQLCKAIFKDQSNGVKAMIGVAPVFEEARFLDNKNIGTCLSIMLYAFFK